ncbi:MAG: hypothetical protein HND44_03915 [Chloroflexi bacterium]|nr:hypothetical protein [Ardenticatenaceae bacterium]MBL1127646.1 hypothetical protein [Chloroflexota bacterium]NOG33711.1 hypothetical protein [Chloroflexota bacterium]GIK56032.1 MAG: hypothetical protein BroJett015_16950 [Chloroflexota bacterium]
MRTPENQDGDFSFSNIPMGWLVVGLGTLVLCCTAVTLTSAVIIFMTSTERGEQTELLPLPATLTPTTAPADTPIPAATVTLAATNPDGRVTAVYLSAPPTLDGNLDEWDSIPPFTAPHIVEQESSWDGTMDVESLWRMGWDNQNLYLAVAVTDNVHVQTRETKFAYLGDSLELQFDTNVQADYGPGVNSDDYQYVVSPGNFSDQAAGAFRFRGDAQGAMSDFIGSGAQVAARQTAVGYNLEMAIPWSDLALQPAAGLVLGAAFSINDLDTPGTAVQELMLSHVATRRWLDPSSWGTLELEP